MNRYKLSIVLRAGLVALLLMMTTGVLAKPTKISPGDDNPGTTDDLSTSDFFISGAIDYDGCFSWADYCSRVYEDSFGVDYDEGTAEAFALDYAEAEVECKAAARASSLSATFLLGYGSLDLNRHGKNGSMHHIEMHAGYLSGAAFRVKAGTFAETYADGDAWVAGFVGGIESACDLEWNYPILGAFCEWAAGEGAAYAEGAATAQSHGAGWAEAGGSGTAGLGLFNGVWAANIEKYVTTVAGGSSNYVWAQGSAQAAAEAEAYVEAALETYVEICESEAYLLFGIIPIYYEEWCDEGFAAAWAEAEAKASAYAAAQASALAATDASVKFTAYYYNANGIEDEVYFVAEGASNGPAQASVSCNKVTY